MKRKRWHPILERLKHGPCKAVEVGVWCAELSHALLRNRSDLHLTLVDPWAMNGMPDGMKKLKLSQRDMDGLYKNALDLSEEYRPRCEVLRKYSVEAALLFRPHHFDIVFLDGDHTYEGVRDDIAAWRDKVKPGGWIGGHDYGQKFPGVAKAAHEAFGDRVKVDTNTTWWVKL